MLIIIINKQYIYIYIITTQRQVPWGTAKRLAARCELVWYVMVWYGISRQGHGACAGQGGGGPVRIFIIIIITLSLLVVLLSIYILFSCSTSFF